MLTADQSTGSAAARGRTLVPLPLDDLDFPEPSQTGPGDPLFGRTLRLALAMKGGVSLAVWIGGAVAEVDVLRRIRIGRGGAFYALPAGVTDPPARAVAYARLLCSRAYDQVEVDVLAGASAGGLNSVLYASAQRADSDPGRLLDLWLEMADLSALLRRPGFARVYSILDGDGYIWPRIIEVLHTLYAPLTSEPGDRPGGAHRVVVDLSATVIDPYPGRGPVGADGSAGFRFVGGGTTHEQHGRRIPSFCEARQPAGIADDLARLAYAGRSTSSFPGAFEPALVWSHPTPPVPPNGHTDLTFAFSAHRAPQLSAATARPTPFRVIDGGVLDNVPIDRALRTITDLPSPEHTDRVLVYLDPSPFEPDTVSSMPLATTPPATPVMTGPVNAQAPRPARRNDRLSAFVGTIAVAVGMRGVREHAEHEIDDVEQARIAAGRARGRRVALSALSEAAQEPGFVETAQRRYALMRASTDADLLTNVLSHPDEWQLHSQLTERRRLRPAPRAVRDALGEELRAQGARAPVEAYLTGPQGIREHALAGLAWMRALEEHAFATTGCARIPDTGHGGPDVQTRIRLTLYTVASRAKAERDRRLFPLVAEFAADEPVPLPDAAAAAARWIEMQSPADPALLEELEEAVVLLTRLAPGGPIPAGSPWTVSPWAHFPAGATAVSLAPFIAPSGVPGTFPSLRFATVTSSDPKPPHPGPDPPTACAAVLPSPLDAVRRELTLEGQARAASRWITLGSRQLDHDRLRLPRSADAAVKLAGSRLANFGAFLSADWRANDWWWGRVDTARGLARVVSGLPAPPSCSAATPPPWTAADRIAIEDDIVADRGGRDAADGSADPWAWRRGLQPLTGLPEPLRFGLVSDGVRVALRAMLPHLGFVPSSLLVLLVPLLAVFVPYLASARRALTAGVFVGLAFLVMFEVHLCRPGTAGCAATWEASVTAAPTRLALELLLVCGVAAIGVWVGGVCLRRFRNAGVVLVAVEDRLRGAQPGLAARIRAARHTMAVFTVMCVLAPLPAIALWVVDTGLAPRAWFALIAAVGTAGTLAVISARVPPAAEAGAHIRRSIAAVLLPGAFAWLVPELVLPLSSHLMAAMPLSGWMSPDRAVTSAVWVLTCVVVAITLTSWWLTWWHAALVTAVAGGLAFVTTLLVTLAAWPLALSVIIGWATITHAIWWLASFDRPRWMRRVPEHRQRGGQPSG